MHAGPSIVCRLHPIGGGGGEGERKGGGEGERERKEGGGGERERKGGGGKRERKGGCIKKGRRILEDVKERREVLALD